MWAGSVPPFAGRTCSRYSPAWISTRVPGSATAAAFPMVRNGAAVLPCVVYSYLERLPVMVGMQMIHSCTAWGAVPFVVKIPAALQGNQDVKNRVDRLVRRYKLLGTRHTIEYYQD